MSPKSKTPPPPPAKITIPSEVAEEPEAKIEWMRIMRHMDGRIDERDRNLLMDYCMTHAEILELKIEVDMEGKTLVGKNGGSYINPLYNILISRQSHLASLRRDLYFTPKSRIEKQTRASLSKAKSIRADLGGDDGSND